jgi:hypothetical protein
MRAGVLATKLGAPALIFANIPSGSGSNTPVTLQVQETARPFCYCASAALGRGPSFSSPAFIVALPRSYAPCIPGPGRGFLPIIPLGGLRPSPTLLALLDRGGA